MCFDMCMHSCNHPLNQDIKHSHEFLFPSWEYFKKRLLSYWRLVLFPLASSEEGLPGTAHGVGSLAIHTSHQASAELMMAVVLSECVCQRRGPASPGGVGNCSASCLQQRGRERWRLTNASSLQPPGGRAGSGDVILMHPGTSSPVQVGFYRSKGPSLSPGSPVPPFFSGQYCLALKTYPPSSAPQQPLHSRFLPASHIYDPLAGSWESCKRHQPAC